MDDIVGFGVVAVVGDDEDEREDGVTVAAVVFDGGQGADVGGLRKAGTGENRGRQSRAKRDCARALEWGGR